MKPLAVSSIFYNLQALLPPKRQRLLGIRWSFAPTTAADRLSEYALPTGYAGRLKQRSGIALICGNDEPTLSRHLDAGGKAIVAVDSHDLPYRPAFGRVHSGRTVVIARAADGSTRIEDPWMPVYAGPIEPADLARARASRVPRALQLEPLFAGRPLDRQWFILDDTLAFQEAAVTAGALAREMRRAEGNCARFLDRLARNLAALPALDAVENCRRAALALRAEISVRPYLDALLAPMLAPDAMMAAALGRWRADIRRGAFANDLLVKSIGRRTGKWAGLVLAELRMWLKGEIRLAALVAEAWP